MAGGSGAPAHQRFGTDEATAACVDLGLVVQAQLPGQAALQRALGRGWQREALPPADDAPLARMLPVLG